MKKTRLLVATLRTAGLIGKHSDGYYKTCASVLLSEHVSGEYKRPAS